MQEIETKTKDHFAFKCLVYYEIRGRHHCLFSRGFGPLRDILEHPDQRRDESQRQRDKLIRAQEASIKPSRSTITDFFSDDPIKGQRGTRRSREPDCMTGQTRSWVDTHMSTANVSSIFDMGTTHSKEPKCTTRQTQSRVDTCRKTWCEWERVRKQSHDGDC